MKRLIIFSMLLLLPFPVHSLTVLVPDDYQTIQAGIDAALPGDTVLVAPGTYTGEGNRDLEFRGKDIVLLSEAGAESTIMDCGSAGRGFNIHEGETDAALIKGFTIQNGYLPDDNGGGIQVYTASPAFEDVTVTQCRAIHGAGIGVAEGSPNFTRVDLIDNHTIGAGSGGGVTLWRATTVFYDCAIKDNTAVWGGGVHYTSSNVTFENVSISGNYAGTAGGGVIALDGQDGSTLTMNRVRIENNYVYSLQGGGLNCGYISGSMNDVHFRGNYSGQSGGGLYLNHSDMLISNCLFEGNSSGSGAGAISSNHSSPHIVSITVVNNSTEAEWGVGGISTHSYSSPLIENSIIAFNEGGGFFNDGPLFPEIVCCDAYGNPGGNYIGNLPDQTGINGNISEDPMFCGDLNPFEPYMLMAESPCMPEGNDCGVQMGAFGAGCSVTGVQDGSMDDSTWSELKSLY